MMVLFFFIYVYASFDVPVMSKLITVLWVHYVHLTDFKSFRLETLPGLGPGFESKTSPSG